MFNDEAVRQVDLEPTDADIDTLVQRFREVNPR